MARTIYSSTKPRSTAYGTVEAEGGFTWDDWRPVIQRIYIHKDKEARIRFGYSRGGTFIIRPMELREEYLTELFRGALAANVFSRQVIEQLRDEFIAAAPLQTTNTPTLYQPTNDKDAFVAEDGGKLWYWRASKNGWEKRQESALSRGELVGVPSYLALGTGWPGVQPTLFEHIDRNHIWVAIFDGILWNFSKASNGWQQREESVYSLRELKAVANSQGAIAGWPFA